MHSGDWCFYPPPPQVTTVVSGVVNRAYSWVVAAHRLLARFDAFLVSGTLSALTTVTDEEETKAKLRVRATGMAEPDFAPDASKSSNRRPAEAGSSSSSRPSSKRPRRRNGSRGGSGGGRGGGRGAGPKEDTAAATANGK